MDSGVFGDSKSALLGWFQTHERGPLPACCVVENARPPRRLLAAVFDRRHNLRYRLTLSSDISNNGLAPIEHRGQACVRGY